MTTKRLVVAMAFLAPMALFGCKEEAAPPPLPTATATAPAAAEPVLVLEQDEPDAGLDAGTPKVGGPGKPAASMKACCAALAQNAETAPEQTATYMRQAAAICSAMVAQGQAGAVVLGAVRGAMQGAQLPGGCR
jgi:hypothetical protein